MTWTQFMDMHSGGSQKLKWAYIYIEAPENEARTIFYNRFDRNPDRVTCTCCGADYSITESGTLEQATGYERGLRWAKPDIADVREQNRRERYLEPGEEPPEGWTVSYVPTFRSERTLDDYLADKDILVVRADELADEERRGSPPPEGYV